MTPSSSSTMVSRCRWRWVLLGAVVLMGLASALAIRQGSWAPGLSYPPAPSRLLPHCSVRGGTRVVAATGQADGSGLADGHLLHGFLLPRFRHVASVAATVAFASPENQGS